MPRTCSTANPRPRMIGLPPKIWGFTVMRSSNFCSSIGPPFGRYPPYSTTMPTGVVRREPRRLGTCTTSLLDRELEFQRGEDVLVLPRYSRLAGEPGVVAGALLQKPLQPGRDCRGMG